MLPICLRQVSLSPDPFAERGGANERSCSATYFRARMHGPLPPDFPTPRYRKGANAPLFPFSLAFTSFPYMRTTCTYFIGFGSDAYIWYARMRVCPNKMLSLAGKSKVLMSCEVSFGLGTFVYRLMCLHGTLT